MATAPPFAVALAAASVLSLVFAGLAWNKREEPGAVPLVAFHVAVGIGTGAYAMEILATDIETQTVLLGVWLVAQAFVPPTWVFAAIEYSGRPDWATRRTAIALAIEPVVVAALYVGVPAPGLFLSLPSTGTAGSLVPTSVETSVLFTLHFVYLFVLALGGSALLVQLFLRSRHMYRTQAAAVLVAAVAPFTVVLSEALGFVPDIDPSALTWALSGMALTFGLYRFKTLDPVPAAHSAIVAEMGDGAIVLDEDGYVNDVNPAARRLLAGPDAGDLTGRHVRTVIDEWDRIAPPDPLADGAGVETTPSTWEEFATTVGSQRRYLEAQVSPFTDRFDRHVGSLVVVRDVTRRKEREQELARYETVFRTTSDPVYVLDKDGRFSMVNESFADFLGRERDAIVGEPFTSMFEEEPDALDDQVWLDAGFSVEVTVTTADGEEIPCEARHTPVEFEDAVGTVGYIRDISRRKRVEADLETTSETLETVVEASPLAVIGTDTEGNVETWNPAAESIFGYEAAAVLGDVAPVIPDDEVERVQSIYQRVLNGERLTGLEMPLERADGEELTCRFAIAPLQAADGTVHGTVAVLDDVTEQIERKRELEATNERLEEFANVVSHDLRNPLQVAEANVEHVMETSDVDRAENALDALLRMETLIDDVLTLARQGQAISETSAVALASVVEAAWAHVETEAASLHTGPLPTVEGDSTRLQELFENLVRNAIEHGGEDVRVVVAELPDRAGFFVADDGPGIPSDRREEIFDAGITTARDGTGFGLAIVEQIADGHDWTVEVLDEAPAAGETLSDGGTADPVDGACFAFYTDP